MNNNTVTNSNNNNRTNNSYNTPTTISNNAQYKSSTSVQPIIRLTTSERLFDLLSSNQLDQFNTLLHSLTSATIANESDSQGRTLLILAADSGNLAAVELLLISINGLSMNSKDKYGLTALMYSVRHGYYEIAVKLLEYKSSVQPITIAGQSALHFAVSNNNTPFNLLCTQLLVQYKANIDLISTNTGYTPLQLAVLYNNISIVEYLLSTGLVNINYQNRLLNGATVLHLAINNELNRLNGPSYLMITELIALGANPEILIKSSTADNHSNLTLLQYAANIGGNTVADKVKIAIDKGIELKLNREKQKSMNIKRAERAAQLKLLREKQAAESAAIAAASAATAVAAVDIQTVTAESISTETEHKQDSPITTTSSTTASIAASATATVPVESKRKSKKDRDRELTADQLKEKYRSMVGVDSESESESETEDDDDGYKPKQTIEEDDPAARAAYRLAIESEWKKQAESSID